MEYMKKLVTYSLLRSYIHVPTFLTPGEYYSPFVAVWSGPGELCRGGGGDDERRGCAGVSGAIGLGYYQEYTLR